MPKPPAPPPEARLLKLARLRRHSTSITEAAALAGVSVSLWRQVETGYSTPAAGVHVPKVAPADTLAVMSRPLGITPAELAKAGREDAAAILAELLRPESAPAAPEPSRETTDPGDADAMESAVVTAALPRREREVWAEMRASLQNTTAGRELFSDLAERTLWPEGSAPIELTKQAERVLDATAPEALFTARSDVLAASMVMYPWHERVRWAAAGRAVLRRPTSAVRRAG